MKEKLFKSIKKELVMQPGLTDEKCHASTLAVLPDGDLLCAWFQGSAEGAEDVKIYAARKTGGSWQPAKAVAQHEGEPCWNPVLFVRPDQKLMLFYKKGKVIAHWQTMFKVSSDGGYSWSEAAELVPGDHGGRGPVRNKITRLADGRLLAPASLEDGPWRSFADISDDGGDTWQKGSEVTIKLSENQKVNQNFREIQVSEQSFHGRGVIQPSFWETDGTVHMVMRSTEGFVYHSTSTDGGNTFSEPLPLDVPNNNSGIDAVKTPDGRVWMVCNPVGESWGKRTPLCLFCSEDDGRSWRQVMVLEDEDAEFSYPGILSSGGKMYIIYTWKRQNVAFWELEL